MTTTTTTTTRELDKWKLELAVSCEAWFGSSFLIVTLGELLDFVLVAVRLRFMLEGSSLGVIILRFRFQLKTSPTSYEQYIFKRKSFAYLMMGNDEEINKSYVSVFV